MTDTVDMIVVTTIVDELNADAHNMRHIYPYNYLVAQGVPPRRAGPPAAEGFLQLLRWQGERCLQHHVAQFFNAILADTTDMSQIQSDGSRMRQRPLRLGDYRSGGDRDRRLTEPGPHNRDNRNRTANDAQPHGPRTKKAGFAKACFLISDSHRFTYPIDEQPDNGTSKNSRDNSQHYSTGRLYCFQKREFIPIPSLKDDFIVFT